MKSVVLVVCCISLALAIPVVKVGIPGKCPKIPFVDNFVSKDFVGKWYAIKETGKEFPCVTYDLKEIRPGHFHADVTPKKVTIEFDHDNVENFDAGLDVSFKVNPYMDEGHAFVFATDYCEKFFCFFLNPLTFIFIANYGGIFICKEAVEEEKEVHYQTISYWSKATTLSDAYLKILDDFLAKYPEIDLSKLNVVKHEDCDAVVEAAI